MFLCGLIVSTMTHISTLISLNLIVFSGLLITIIRYQKSLAGYFKYWLKLNLFTLLVWLTLSWKITEQGLTLNPMGIQLALLITLRFNLILSLTRLLLIDMNESLLLQALCRLPLPEKTHFTSLFSLCGIFQCSVKIHKRWIWQCVHAATSQN